MRVARDLPFVGGLVGLALAVALRVSLAGRAGAGSPTAGVVFGTALVVLALVCGLPRPVLNLRQAGWGAALAAVLCVVPAVRRVTMGGVAEPEGMLPLWSAVVAYVAVAEELLLRGALFERARERSGDVAAVAVTALAFALLHVPVYGWQVLPLDLAVGVCLGAVRLAAGSVTAPAVAHTLADLAGWWLR
ncbi:CPBP family intramembrane glutamic endopeptidase [Streptacidiphilus jiangxiensis]|uniref:CAAX protease self-immunity n=1 Tax=Streptacidiphilus jiangxiensis TaxID=235985 RepID=A0A1H7V517_STRJI|nr:CPBP family intramembrane glutamic endopeptidase [Streptacidiphilus jiangxiensis]SEM04283.1 CAAX protease self-immunity [Streptacidiphilus jiangxiensis]